MKKLNNYAVTVFVKKREGAGWRRPGRTFRGIVIAESKSNINDALIDYLMDNIENSKVPITKDDFVVKSAVPCTDFFLNLNPNK